LQISRTVLKSFLTAEQTEQLLSRVHMSTKTSTFILPLSSNKHLFGTLMMWGDQLSEEQLPLFDSFAKQIAIALFNNQLIETEQTARKQSEILRDVSQKLSSPLDQSALLPHILRQLGRIITFKGASIMLFDDDEGLTIAAQTGIYLTNEMSSAMDFRSLSGIQKIIETQKPMTIPDTNLNGHWKTLPNQEHIRCWAGVPLLAKDKLIGILNIDHDQPNFFTQKELKWAFAFANQAALAIDNARLYSQAQNHAINLEKLVNVRTKALTLLHNIASTTNDYQNLEGNLASITRQIQDHFKIAGVAIYRHPFLSSSNNPDWELFFHAGTLPDSFLAADRRFLEKTVAHVTEPHEKNGGDQTHCWVEGPTQHCMYSQTIMTRGQIFGYILLFGQSVCRFTPEDHAVILTISEHFATFFENKYLQNQMKEAAAANERRRLANDLHDSVTQSLYSLTLFAKATQERLNNQDYDPAYEYTTNIKTISLQALKEMRLLLYELRAESILDKGIKTALQERLEIVERRASIEALLLVNGLQTLPQQIESNLYQIAIEGLNNTLKHASAKKVIIEINQNESMVHLKISDDGVGFDLSQAKDNPGMGLAIIQERVENLHGTYEIRTAPQKGTQIDIILPLSHKVESVEAL
jgi:signal transduction histidine kinase